MYFLDGQELTRLKSKMAVIWNDVILSSYDVMKSRGDVSLAKTTEKVSYVISSF